MCNVPKPVIFNDAVGAQVFQNKTGYEASYYVFISACSELAGILDKVVQSVLTTRNVCKFFVLYLDDGIQCEPVSLWCV